jgi:hypothetical protein
VVEGRCFCGTVRFTLDAKPKWVAHCHCSMCRRAHAAGYVTWAGFPKSALRFTAGETNIADYRSSPPALRRFCRTCGSQLFFLHETYADEVHVPRALLSDDLGMAPKAHIYFSDRVDWMPVHDDLRKKGGPTGLDPLPS